MFNFFKRKPVYVAPAPVFAITEGVAGHFQYHVSKSDKTTRSLCGAQTMHTSIPLNLWGVKDHLPSKWCKICEEMVEDAK